MVNSNKFLREFGDFLSSISSKSYKDQTYDIVEHFSIEFRNPDFVLSLDEQIRASLVWLPFHLSFSNRDTSELIDIRHQLIHYIDKIENKNYDKLVSIGNGIIDKHGIIVVGMAAGFRGENRYDEISYPFKPSFYFGNASRILRLGLIDHIHEIYFTNLAKYALSKQIMNSSGKYEEIYEECFPWFEKELELLEPRLILAVGMNVYQTLMAKKVPCVKVVHPSYFFFREGENKGIEYYSNLKIN